MLGVWLLVSNFSTKNGLIHLVRVIVSHFVFFGFADHFAINAIATGFGGDVDIATVRTGGVFGKDFGGD